MKRRGDFGKRAKEQERDGRDEALTEGGRRVGVSTHPGVIHIREETEATDNASQIDETNEGIPERISPETKGSTTIIPSSDPMYPAATPKPDTRPEFRSSGNLRQKRVVRRHTRTGTRCWRQRRRRGTRGTGPSAADPSQADASEQRTGRTPPFARAVRGMSRTEPRDDRHREAERGGLSLPRGTRPAMSERKDKERQKFIAKLVAPSSSELRPEPSAACCFHTEIRYRSRRLRAPDGRHPGDADDESADVRPEGDASGDAAAQPRA